MNSNLLVGKYYGMDPSTEDLIRGTKLQNGMVVLVESPALRQEPNGELSPADRNHLMRSNRWCEVSEFEFRNNGDIMFIGIYADGSKATRMYSRETNFYVKLDSVPKSPENQENPDAETVRVELEVPKDRLVNIQSGEGPLASALREVNVGGFRPRTTASEILGKDLR